MFSWAQLLSGLFQSTGASPPEVKRSEAPSFRTNMLSVMVEQQSGQWREVKRIEYLSTQYVSDQLRRTQQSNLGKRVRAVDQGGRLVDMMG